MAEAWDGLGAGRQPMVYSDGSGAPAGSEVTFTGSAAGRVLVVEQRAVPAGSARVVVRGPDGAEVVGGRYVIRGGETLRLEPVDFPRGQTQRVELRLRTEPPPG
jgi:hypothetical protein